MRIVVRLLVAAAVLVVVALGALAVLLPGLADSERVRTTIEQASTDALGRPLRYADLDVGLLPPRIELSAPRIPGATDAAPALLEAERVSLRIALAPLLALAVVIDSLVVEGLEIEIRRTPEGIELPTPPARDEPAPVEETAESDDGSGSPIALAVRSVMVRDSRIAFADSAVTPPVTWSLERVEIEARGTAVDAPIDLTGGADLGTGGRIELAGTATTAGVLDLAITLAEIALEDASVYAGPGARLDATLDGRIAIRGPAAAPEALRVELVLASSAVEVGGASVSGDTKIEAALAGDLSEPTGSFAVDATGARVASGEAFAKPVGTTALVSGRFAPGAGGLTLTLTRVELASLMASGEVALGDPMEVALDAEPFEVAGVLALLPAAASADVTGQVALDGLRARLEPLSLSGEIAIADLAVGLAGGGRVDVAGRIVGRGDGVDLVDVDVSAGDQHIAISGQARDLTGRIPFSVKLANVGVLRADPLVTALDPASAGVLFGPLTIGGAIEGRAGDDLLDSLVGGLDVNLGDSVGDGSEGGRLVGFSALGSVVDGLRQAGELVRVAGILSGGKVPDLGRFTSEDFQRMQASFRVHDGLLDSRQVRIVYRDHAVNLKGTVRLEDLALDMTGEVQLGSAVVAAMGAQAADGEVTVPLAHVGGTVAAPEIEVSDRAVTALGGQLVARNPQVKSAVQEAEKVLPGAGGLIEGILGGGRR